MVLLPGCDCCQPCLCDECLQLTVIGADTTTNPNPCAVFDDSALPIQRVSFHKSLDIDGISYPCVHTFRLVFEDNTGSEIIFGHVYLSLPIRDEGGVATAKLFVRTTAWTADYERTDVECPRSGEGETEEPYEIVFAPSHKVDSTGDELCGDITWVIQTCECPLGECEITIEFLDENQCEDDVFDLFLVNPTTLAERFIQRVDLKSDPAGKCGDPDADYADISIPVTVTEADFDAECRVTIEVRYVSPNCCSTWTRFRIRRPGGSILYGAYFGQGGLSTTYTWRDLCTDVPPPPPPPRPCECGSSLAGFRVSLFGQWFTVGDEPDPDRGFGQQVWNYTDSTSNPVIEWTQWGEFFLETYYYVRVELFCAVGPVSGLGTSGEAAWYVFSTSDCYEWDEGAIVATTRNTYLTLHGCNELCGKFLPGRLPISSAFVSSVTTPGLGGCSPIAFPTMSLRLPPCQ